MDALTASWKTKPKYSKTASLAAGKFFSSDNPILVRSGAFWEFLLDTPCMKLFKSADNTVVLDRRFILQHNFLTYIPRQLYICAHYMQQ